MQYNRQTNRAETTLLPSHLHHDICRTGVSQSEAQKSASYCVGNTLHNISASLPCPWPAHGKNGIVPAAAPLFDPTSFPPPIHHRLVQNSSQNFRTNQNPPIHTTKCWQQYSSIPRVLYCRASRSQMGWWRSSEAYSMESSQAGFRKPLWFNVCRRSCSALRMGECSGKYIGVLDRV